MRPAHSCDPDPLTPDVSPPARPRARPRRGVHDAGRLAARGLLALVIGAGTSARALDLWADTPITLPPIAINTTGSADCTQPPGVATCQDNDWVVTCEADYGSTDPNDSVNNPCLAPQAPSGQSFAEQAQAAASSPAATSESVFVPNGSLQPLTPLGAPAPITDRFAAAVPSPSRSVMESVYGPMTLQNTNPASVTSWANQELIAQYDAWNTRGLDPLTYQRYTNTTEYFDPIPSCENYVYRSFRDVEVWIDGINACGSLPKYERRGVTPVDQARCMVNTSLNGYTTTGSGTPPAIFRRRPQNADGNYIYDPTDPDNHITELINKGAMDQIEADPFSDTWQLSNIPKNAFYAGTEWLITANIFSSMIAQGIDAQDMVNEMNRGDGLYEAGKGVPTSNGGYYLDAQQKLHQGFYDEWDFHNYMNQGTQATTAGQSREFRRRNDQLVQAVGQLADAMKCLYSNALDIPPGGCAGSNIPNALGKVNPGDEQEYENDPLQMNSILSAIMPSQLALPPSLFGQVGFGANLQPSQYSLSQLASLNLVSGAQNIPESAHAPGLLSADAQTNSVLLGALDLPPGLVARAPAIEVEDLAATQARLADLLSAQQVMQINNLGNIGTGLGLLDELGVLLDGNAQAAAREHKPAPGPNLANYVQTYTPNPGSIQYPTSFLVETAWSVNPPRWGADTNTGLPILDCSTTRIREGEGGGTTNLGNVGDVPEAAGVISTLVVDGKYHTDQMWPALCQVTNLLLQEWERVQLGNPSCLDKNSVSCDWVPQDFVDRFVTQNVGYASAAKEIEYSYCKRWTGGGQVDSTVKDIHGNLVDGVPQSADRDLIDFRDFLDVREAAFEKEMKTVPVQGNDDFGKIKTDGNGLGNSEFGGGYTYTLGWHATAYRYTSTGESDPLKEYNGQICRLGGNMQAGFTAYAVLFGDQIDIIDADVQVDANDKDNGLAQGWADLTIATFTVFTFGSENAPQDLTASYTPFNKFDTEKPQFVEAPFQVGWITVTVKAGVEFDYGASLTLSSQVPQKGSCHPDHPDAWEAKGVFEPKADLGVWVDADVSLAGIFGVGIEVDLTLLGLGLPLTVDVALGLDPDNGQNAINFDAELDLTLNTLSGELDFYIIAFWAKVASFKIVGWQGFTAKFPIFRTRPVSLDLGELPAGTVLPPGGTDASEDI